MVRIRLRRTGLKHQTTYRIMAADKESPRDGRFLEILGSYNPRTNPSTVEINEARVYDWMNQGAQPSDSVIMVFKSVGLLDRYARLKAGESREALLEESKTAYEKHAAGSKTGAMPTEVKKAAPKKATKETPAAAPKAEPTAAAVPAPEVVVPAPEVVAEAAAEAAAEVAPEVEAAAETAAEAAAESVVEAAAESVVEAAPEPVAESAPVIEAAVEPTVEAAAETPVETKPE
jgi:small subunit ribosomal protein S16